MRWIGIVWRDDEGLLGMEFFNVGMRRLLDTPLDGYR